METKEQPFSAGKLAGDIRDYSKTLYSLGRLKLVRKTADVSAALTGAVLVGLLLTFSLLILSIAAAWWLGDILNNRTAGFLLMGSFYVLAGCFLLFTRKSILLPFIRKRILSVIYEKKTK